MEFNSRDVFDKSGFEAPDLKEAFNLYEITENLEEYYRQKAPNLWNAWIRTNNMLVEMNERYDKQVRKINYLYKTIDGISEQLDRMENILSKNQERKPNTQNPTR